MTQDLVERMRDLAEEVEQLEGNILFVSMDEAAVVEAAKALLHGGAVPCKDIGALLHFVADMGEE